MRRHLVSAAALIVGLAVGAVGTMWLSPSPAPSVAVGQVSAPAPSPAPATTPGPSLRSLEGLLVEMENKLDRIERFQECWHDGGTPQDGWCLMPADASSAGSGVA